MQIVNDNDENFNLSKSVITIGTFDGIHIGHSAILDELCYYSKEKKSNSVVITFNPHPRTVINKNYNIKILTTFEEKQDILYKYNIDYLYVINFTKEFSKTTYKDFINKTIINKLGAVYIVVGYDHKFGKDRDGDISKLMEIVNQNSIGISVIGSKDIDGEIVSSTKIRNAINSGKIELANKMLGRNYSLSGIVVEGAKRGRTLGFPTANISVDDSNKMVPQNGVYFVEVIFNNKNYFGVLNIGLRPTFNNSKEPITEVHILDFNENIYGKKLTIRFYNRLRNEIKFESKEKLEKQIKEDIIIAKSLINK